MAKLTAAEDRSLQAKAMKVASLSEEYVRAREAIVDAQLHHIAIRNELSQAEDDYRAAKYEIILV